MVTQLGDKLSPQEAAILEPTREKFANILPEGPILEGSRIYSEAGHRLIETIRDTLTSEADPITLGMKAGVVWESLGNVILDRGALETLKVGALSEVATYHLLKGSGFEVAPSSESQDRFSKVDMWAYDKEGVVFAVYVVGKRKDRAAHVTLVNPKGTYSDYFAKDIGPLLQGIDDLKREDLPVGKDYKGDIAVHAIIVEIPTDSEAIFFNTTTGMPDKETRDTFYEKHMEAVHEKAHRTPALKVLKQTS